MINRAVAPISHPISGFQLIRPERVTLSNGAQLFLLDGGSQDLTRIEWIFQNDYSHGEHSLLNTVASGMLMEGTQSYTHRQIADTIDFYGAYLIPEFSHDHSSLKLFSLNKHLPKLFPILKSILTESTFPTKELNTYLRNGKQRLQVALQKNDFIARRQFGSTLFGANRYGIVPQIEDYDQISREDLLRLYQKQFNPANCTIVISGKIDPKLLVDFQSYFDETWPAQEPYVSANSLPTSATRAAQRVYTERPNALQSAIRLGCKTIGRSHPDFPALQFVNTLLGGYFGSRLMANIREDKGYTYGIGSGIVSLKHDAYFTIATEVGVDVTGATLAEVEKEINRLRTELVGPEELTLAKNYILGSMLGSLENVFAHGDKFKNAYFSGLDIDYYDYYVDKIKVMDADVVLGIANTYLDFGDMTKVIVGKGG